jgi:hypothetical protein
MKSKSITPELLVRRATSLVLTAGYGEKLEAQIRTTYRGQYHFAGGGPAGAQCDECKHYRNSSCDLVALTLRMKTRTKFPGYAGACKYFETKGA